MVPEQRVDEEQDEAFEGFCKFLDNSTASYFAASFPQFVPCELHEGKGKQTYAAIIGPVELDGVSCLYIPVYTAKTFAERAFPELMNPRPNPVVFVILPDFVEAYKFYRSVFLAAGDTLHSVQDAGEKLKLVYNPFVFRKDPYPFVSLVSYLGAIRTQHEEANSLHLLSDVPKDPNERKEEGGAEDYLE